MNRPRGEKKLCDCSKPAHRKNGACEWVCKKCDELENRLNPKRIRKIKKI